MKRNIKWKVDVFRGRILVIGGIANNITRGQTWAKSQLNPGQFKMVNFLADELVEVLLDPGLHIYQRKASWVRDELSQIITNEL